MDVQLERVAYRWDCPLPEADLPKEKVQRALLCLRHGAGGSGAQAVARALQGVAGRPRAVRVPLLGAWLRFRHPSYGLRVRVRGDVIEVRSLRRLNAANLRRLVTALAQVPGAQGLELHGEVPHYSKAFSNLRACSPCQARRM